MERNRTGAEIALALSLALVVLASGLRGQGTVHLLQRHHPRPGPASFPWSHPPGGGDVNGDGLGDLILAHQPVTGTYYEILSGISGASLLTTPVVANSPGRARFVGDLDGDGADDFALLGDACSPTALEIRSGATAGVLLSIPQPAPGIRARTFAGGGDVDGDSVPDLIVALQGSPPNPPFNPCPNTSPPRLNVYAGASGALLHSFIDPSMTGPVNWYGVYHDHAGDVNGDGFGDIIFSDRGLGRVWVHSGLDGSLLHFLQGSVQGRFGEPVAGIGDVDGDQLDDFLVSAGQMTVSGLAVAGQVWVYSATGAIIRTHTGSVAEEYFGHSLGAIGDMDGDGVGDYFVTAGGSASAGVPGSLNAFSGATGSLLFNVVHPLAGGTFWGSRVGDVNGDGLADLAGKNSQGGLGFVNVYSMNPASALVLEAAPALGTVVPLSVLSPADPGRPYLCGFSAGMTPGILLADGRTVPVNLDPFLILSLTSGNPYFANTVGALDIMGTATVTVSIPSLPALNGATLFATFLVQDPAASLGVGTISHPRAITFHL